MPIHNILIGTSRLLGKNMRRIYTIFGVILIAFCLVGWMPDQPVRTIRVGAYENSPKIFTASDGTISGFWPDLIREIAREENWNIVWVHGSWEECLQRLEANDIDVMPDVGWSEDRSKLYAFSNETTLNSWARLYVPSGSKIETILDLEGKTVAGLAGSLNFDGPEGIKTLSKNFGVHSTYVNKSSYDEVFAALKNREVDAGITNKDFGDLNEQKYGVTRTPVIIQPTQIYFAFSKNAELTPFLINIFDNHIKALKADKNSVYYQALDQWMGGKSVKAIVPAWVNTVLPVSAGMILALLIGIFIVREQVHRQTTKLRVSESRNQALLENIPDLIFRINIDGYFLDYHTATEKRLYVRPENFLGKNATDVLPPELAKATLEKVRQAIKTKEIQILEYQLEIDGEIRDHEARYTASGENEVIAIIRDITARKQADKELKESEERYQTLARVSPVGIFYADINGRTTYVNPTWCKISGISSDEALGDGWLKAVHPDDRQSLADNWIEAARQHTVSTADYRFVHPDDSIVWVIGQAVPEKDADDRIVGYVGSVTDITERKQFEVVLQRSITSEREALAAQAAIAIQNAKLHEELQQYADELEQRVAERTNELAKRVAEVETLNSTMVSLMEDLKAAVQKAESADRLKSAFLATMSHELRTPLNSIIGFSGILLQKLVGPLSPEQEKQLRMVQGSAQHLLELINDVLDISKIEADQLVIGSEIFDMGTAVQRSIEKIIPLVEKKGLKLTSTVIPDVIEITGDRRRVEQILLNLLNNAVKFTDQGEVQLECRIEKEFLVIKVKDTGIGIRPEDMQTLFKPFKQIDTGISRQYEGTGLGLSICKRLVELMGGEIWAESNPGKGSTFTFTLPYQKGPS